jgi:hypothetical protein
MLSSKFCFRAKYRFEELKTSHMIFVLYTMKLMHTKQFSDIYGEKEYEMKLDLSIEASSASC